jgi:hypothetical protein
VSPSIGRAGRSRGGHAPSARPLSPFPAGSRTRRSPRSGALLAVLPDPDRGFHTIVIGEYERAFNGGQYAAMADFFSSGEVRGLPLRGPHTAGDPAQAGGPLSGAAYRVGDLGDVPVLLRTAILVHAGLPRVALKEIDGLAIHASVASWTGRRAAQADGANCCQLRHAPVSGS